MGVKDSGLLESAVVRAQSSAFGNEAYPSIYEKSAAIFQSLGQNHPFHNANKRTAFTALVIFLRYNNVYLKMDQTFAEDFTVDMVNHKFTFEELVSIIRTYCVTENEE
ncbi:type II toxin-antitoxin system death-on-curing family toxin [Paenibacillus amylolyticus]|uniref:type II toxin-antitoxin system death-on-curing family toxin n=1 Tax=Paenibacillus amylolyticus TaxID=1451 RepID=UPI003242A353